MMKDWVGRIGVGKLTYYYIIARGSTILATYHVEFMFSIAMDYSLAEE